MSKAVHPWAMTEEQVELLYEDWKSGEYTQQQLIDRHQISMTTLARKRREGNWTQRVAIEKLENLKGKRQVADETLTDNLPKLMRQAVNLALNAESESVQAQMTRYLLGTTGYSPEASEQWLKGIEAKLAQMAEERKQNDETAQAPEDLSDYFSNAIDLSGVTGGQPPYVSNGEAEPEAEFVENPGAEEFEDWR